MRTDEKLPALRHIDLMPFRDGEGEVRFLLQDNSGVSSQPIAVSPAGYAVIAHLDGGHSVEDIQAVFKARFQQDIPADQIIGLVAALDEALMLNTARYAAAYDEHVAAYAAAAARDNAANWGSGAEVRAEIETVLADGAPPPTEDVAGLIVPHLDYRRGAPCYADGYAVLDEVRPAERYVLLGTNHAGRSLSVVATGKDFATPLGLVKTDVAFIEELERRLGASIRTHELDHLREHSIELQVHILQVIQKDTPFEIVPILCPDPCGPTGTRPADGQGPDLGEFADALGAMVRETDRRTIIIAGADLSHVGQRFGDQEPSTPEFLEGVGQRDRQLLQLLEQRREDEFIDALRAASNNTRVCSAGSIYTLLRALPDHQCRVLSYHQAVDYEQETHVTCAAAVVM